MMADITDQARLSRDESSNYFPTIDSRLISPFSPIKKSIGVHSRHSINVYPTHPIGVHDAEITFETPPTGSALLDLRNADVHIKGKLVNSDGTDLSAEEEAMLVRNSYCTLFDQVKVYLGKSYTEIDDFNFPFKGFIKTVYENSSERMSTAYLAGTSFQNKGDLVTDYRTQVSRQTRFAKSIDVEFISNTHISFFSTAGYIPANTPLRVRYRRTPPTFYSLTDGVSTDKTFRFDIDLMYIRIPTVRVMPQIAPHLDKLRMEVNPRLYFDNFVVKNYPISKDSQTRTFNSVFTGNLPKLLFLSFYDEDTFVGKNNLDPYFTSGEKINDVTVITNGYNAMKFEVNVKNKIYGQAYKAFVDAMGGSGKAFCISYDIWGEGNEIYAFDFLNCDNPSGDNCASEMLMQGSIDITVNWSEKVTKSQILLIHALSTDSVELRQDGGAILNRVVV
jgi:hypothetical protein